MKSRLSSTIWMLIILNGFAMFIVLGLAYSAGRQSAANSTGFDASGLIIPAVVALGTTIILAWRLGGGILFPVSELAAFSERLAAGDGKARADVSSSDEFGYIAENLNRAVAKVMVARRLAVRLYWMLRQEWTYTELVKHLGKPESSCGKR